MSVRDGHVFLVSGVWTASAPSGAAPALGAWREMGSPAKVRKQSFLPKHIYFWKRGFCWEVKQSQTKYDLSFVVHTIKGKSVFFSCFTFTRRCQSITILQFCPEFTLGNAGLFISKHQSLRVSLYNMLTELPNRSQNKIMATFIFWILNIYIYIYF